MNVRDSLRSEEEGTLTERESAGSLDRTIVSRDQSHAAGGWKDVFRAWAQATKVGYWPGNTIGPNASRAGLSIADTAQPFEIGHAEPMNISSPIFLALRSTLCLFNFDSRALIPCLVPD